MTARAMRRAGAAVAALTLMTTACTAPADEDTVVAEPSVIACQLSDERGVIDHGINSSVADGLAEAEKTIGAATRQVESGTPADHAADLASLTAQSCDIVIGAGQDLVEPIQAAAALAADEKFVLVDAAFSNADGALVVPENGKSVQFAAAEGGFLAGYLAAGLSITGKVGVIGGTDSRQTKAAMDGFSDGVAAYNAANQTQVAPLGWDKGAQSGVFAGSVVDATRGQSAATTLITEGADVIVPVGGPFGTGALQAAAATEGTSVIWFGGLGTSLPGDPDLIAGSIVFDAEPVVLQSIQQTADADFDTAPYLGTVQNSGIVLHTDVSRVGAAQRDLGAQLDDVEAGLADGSVVPETTNGPLVEG